MGDGVRLSVSVGFSTACQRYMRDSVLGMTKARMEMFSDGVIAILITIMVLELKAPQGATLAALRGTVPSLLTYVMSFLFLGTYWNSHHHMLHLTEHVNGVVLWANLHLLFWLSLIPFATSWMAASDLAAAPTAF